MPEPDILDRITTKIGPLPAWAWVAIPAAGYVAWSYYRASQDEDVPIEDTASTVDEYGINVPSSSLPSYSTAPNSTSNLPYIDTPTYNNQTWSRQAINYLISEGLSASDAVTAINAYIYGVPATINSTQMNALQKAITRFGPAPESAFIPKLGTSPSPTPTPTKVPEAPTTVNAVATGTSVRVTWGAPQVTNGTILGYKVEMWIKDKTGKWVARANQLALPVGRSVTFTGLSHKQWYSFRVYARNSKGFGPFAYKSVYVP